MGGASAASYCASKAAVINLIRCLAIDHAKAGIRVDCVCPGDTGTNMLTLEAHQLGKEPSYFLREAADHPLGRVGDPKEIAEAIYFLASSAASYITGAVLVVDGGGTAG